MPLRNPTYPAVPVVVELDVSYTLGNKTQLFGTKIIDVRYQARRFYKYARQSGVEAKYYEAYFCPHCQRDPLNWTFDNITFDGKILNFASGCAVCNNRGILYLPPQTVRIMFPDDQQGATQKQEGRIEQETAMINVPLIGGIKRLDYFLAQDKIWVVTEEPKYMFSEKRNTIIYLSCVVRGIRHTISRY